MSDPRHLTVSVVTHPATRTLSVTVAQPGGTPVTKSCGLALFREWVAITADWVARVEGKGAAQDFRGEMRLIEVRAEEEFARGGSE
jgi:hypothetical protein